MLSKLSVMNRTATSQREESIHRQHRVGYQPSLTYFQTDGKLRNGFPLLQLYSSSIKRTFQINIHPGAPRRLRVVSITATFARSNTQKSTEIKLADGSTNVCRPIATSGRRQQQTE
jgi:hypothetical protein